MSFERPSHSDDGMPRWVAGFLRCVIAPSNFLVSGAQPFVYNAARAFEQTPANTPVAINEDHPDWADVHMLRERDIVYGSHVLQRIGVGLPEAKL